MAMKAQASASRITNLDGQHALRLVSPRHGDEGQVSPTGRDPLVVGKRIRHRRKAAGLTLDGLGRRVGLSASALSLIETGKREAKVSALAAVADALECRLADLLSDSAPSRRAALELRLERLQHSADFAALGVHPVKTGP